MEYSDPHKVKVYIEAGVPVVMTRVSAMAGELERRRAGLVVNCSRAEIESAISDLLQSPSLWKELRDNVLKMAKDYDYRALYNKAFGVHA
jgi:glycosyltransferase involved in cell wall biosynthesis